MKKTLLASSFVLAMAGVASADVHSDSWAYYLSLGQLNAGSPTWQRPSATFVAGSGTLERYRTMNFAHVGGGLTSVVWGTNPANWDTFLHTYTTFNPATPTTGGLVGGGNDDMSGIGTASRVRNVTAAAGNYTSVFSEFSLSAVDRDSRGWAYPSVLGDYPDNNPAGLSKTITVGASAMITAFNSVTLRGLSHTWAGDNVVTLTHGGVTVDLMDRLGAVSAGAAGEDSNLIGDFTFMLGAPAMVTPTAALYTLGGTFAPNANGTAGQSSLATGILSDFVGMDVAGPWVLSLSDRAAGDLGGISGWDFDVTVIPTPGSLALLGLAGLVGIRRRR